MSKINLKNGRVEDYTIVLSNRSQQHLGRLVGIESTTVKNAQNLNSENNFSFNVYKYKLIPEEGIPYKSIEAFQKYIWDNLIDFKLIWIKELNEYYQIKVSIEDSQNTIKTINATSLCEAELSRLMIFGTEINTEDDIARDDYEITTFCNFDNHNASLLHRLFRNKAPHYTIKYVDESLWDLQRVFSIDNTSLYDFMTGECSQQFDCLFQFDSSDRSVSVYDLMTVCKDCGERGDFIDECPSCSSANLKYYGKDTGIYVDKNHLTDSIHLEVDSDSIKNCFKLECGDEVMTAAVRALNPNGTDYFYVTREEDRNDMPNELVAKLDAYNELYQSYLDEYQKRALSIYDLTDQILYYESSMMPTIEEAEITAETEAAKLTVANLSPIAITELTDSTSLTTVNSALKNYAKVYVKTGYVKLDIEDGATFSVSSSTGLGTWKGRFKVTNYSDETDIAYSATLTITVNDNYDEWLTQKVEKEIASYDDENSIFDVLTIETLADFKTALTYYSKNRLVSFKDAIQSALDILVTEKQATKGAELYSALYTPYYNKLRACESEINKRETTINSLTSQKTTLESQQAKVQKQLNLQTYLGDLYLVFCSYRREDKYSNSNYISDGLDNLQLLQRAEEFWELAQKDLLKSSSGECSITAPLHNLLLIPEFEPLVDNFELGNWIRIRVDGVLYRLRLIGYEINFSDIQTINVTFSNVAKIKNQRTERDNILNSAKSMATNYSSVQKQAEKGSVANTAINSAIQNGMNSSLINIKNNTDEDITFTERGLLFREKDDITEQYSPKQFLATHNVLAFTKDNWESVSLGLGEHDYSYYYQDNGKFKLGTATDYGLSSKFVQAGYVIASQVIGSSIFGGDIYSLNYDSANGIGSHFGLNDGTLNLGNKFVWDGTNLNINGNGTFTGTITGSEISGSKIVALALEDNDSNIEIKNGYIRTYDPDTNHTYFRTCKQGILQWCTEVYDDNDNYSGQNYAMSIYVSPLYGNTQNQANINLGSSDTNTSLLIGRGNALGSVYLPYVSINAHGDAGVSLHSTLNAAGHVTAGGGLTVGSPTITSVIQGSLNVWSDFTVGGTKSRLANTENYNDRLLYCYEMPSPMFGDIGEGQIDETGKCYIFLDDIFAETIDTDCIYQVFLQPYGQGECYVTERTSSYFVVEGTKNLSFGWEIKAVQKDYDTIRLEEPQEIVENTDYATETYNYLIESMEG